MDKNTLQQFEQRLGYSFKNKTLLQTALTHKTYAFEASEPLEYNERLEFLGDSVLNFIVTEELYNSNKYFSEGELTRRRAMIVNNKVLAKKAQDLLLGKFLQLGKGEIKQQGATNHTNLANAFEAVIGAMFLDAGLQQTHSFIVRYVLQEKKI